MLRFLFAAILLLHGLIHLMGFAKAFKYAEISQLTIPISRLTGSFWLLASVILGISALLFLLKNDAWWMVAIPAILLSQALIFQYWRDAKFGTIANGIVLIGIVFAWGTWSFNQMIQNELKNFLSEKRQPVESVLTPEMLSELPPIVQTWLERSNCVGKPLVPVLHFHQQGEMRTSLEGRWMPFEADQYTRFAQPGFLWKVRVHAPFLQLVGRDKYQDGKGYMLIKLFSLFPVANAQGPETDQGALLRYLGEIVWSPNAALSDYIHWTPIDARSAKAVMRYGGVEASGVFTFTAEGDPMRFEALRYYNRKGGATLEKWRVEIDSASFQTFAGIRIPARSSVFWALDSGDFCWLKLNILSRKYPAE